ncbi:MAG: hypothetical protein A3I83_01515 [Methylotenera sp. RIFCSPLOWO2_02_FULL_45_14]|nr:MAG: hypothetical protein A3I83_01515 [Methylotenera sp. RIFCSPLOWO2_02_FULL_45_14]
MEALASAWVKAVAGAGFPPGFDGTESPDAHHAIQIVEARIRDYIVSNNDRRLFSLLHLLGHASLRMEQVLWPEEYSRIEREVEEALADDSPSIPHEEVKAQWAIQRAELLKKHNAK